MPPARALVTGGAGTPGRALATMPLARIFRGAGGSRYGPLACRARVRRLLLDIDPTQWSTLIDMGLAGAFLGARISGARMATRGHGHILNLASITGPSGMATMPPPTPD